MSGKRRFVDLAKEAMGKRGSDDLTKGIGCMVVRIILEHVAKAVNGMYVLSGRG